MVGPSAHSITDCQKIFIRKSCVLSTFVRFFRMGLEDLVVDKVVTLLNC